MKWSFKETLPTSIAEEEPSKTVLEISISFKSVCWHFDGVFQNIEEKHKVTHKSENDDPFPISDLGIFPLHLAPTATNEALAERGKMFWKCRHKKYVAYEGWDYERREQYVSTLPPNGEERIYLSSTSQTCDLWST